MTGSEPRSPELTLPRWKNSLQINEDVQRLKRDAVIKEAGRAFGKRGYHNTSLDDVAKTLNVSKGTLYNYVKDKQEILFECHKIAQEIGERAFSAAQASGGTAAERLRLTLVAYITSLTEELGACSALMEVDALRAGDREEAVKRRDSFVRRLVTLIKDGIKDGSLRTVDPTLAVFTFMGAINWLPRWYAEGGRLSGREIAVQMADMLMNGLLPNVQSVATPAAESKRRSRIKQAPGR